MLKEIHSKNNRYMQLARSLRQKKYREKERLFLIEGIKNAEEAQNAAWPFAFGFYTADLLTDLRGEELLAKLSAETEMFLLDNTLFSLVASTEQPQPVVLIGEQKEYTADAFLSARDGQVLVLDALQDPGNIGTIFRTAWAAGVKGIFLTPDCADIYNPKVVRSAMGGLYHMPFVYLPKEEIYKRLQAAKYRILLADARGISYRKSDLSFPLAFVLGNEANGLSSFWANTKSELIGIPQEKDVESLNVAVACGILIFAAKK